MSASISTEPGPAGEFCPGTVLVIRTVPVWSCRISPSTSVSLASTSNSVWAASSLRVSVSSTATGSSLTLAISTAISVVWELTVEPSASFSPASLTFAVSCKAARAVRVRYWYQGNVLYQRRNLERSIREGDEAPVGKSDVQGR